MSLFIEGEENSEINDYSYEDNINTKENSKRKELKKADIEYARRFLYLLDEIFNIYQTKQLKELAVIPVISKEKIDISEIETLDFSDSHKMKIKRKLLILQKVYIEGNPKTILGEDYIESKTYINDKSALIEDLSILLYGAEGINYRILEKNAFEL